MFLTLLIYGGTVWNSDWRYTIILAKDYLAESTSNGFKAKISLRDLTLSLFRSFKLISRKWSIRDRSLSSTGTAEFFWVSGEFPSDLSPNKAKYRLAILTKC